MNTANHYSVYKNRHGNYIVEFRYSRWNINYRFRGSLRTRNKAQAYMIADKLSNEHKSGRINVFDPSFALAEWLGIADFADKRTLTIAHAIDAFLIEQKHLKANSITAYTTILRSFDKFHGFRLNLGSVTETDVQKFLLRGTAIATQHKDKRHLKRFFTYCMEKDWIAINPAKFIKLEKQPDINMSKVVFAHHYEPLMRAVEKTRSPAPWFDCFLITMIECGMRRSEMMDLRWKDLDSVNLHINGAKTSSHRIMEVPQSVKDSLTIWRSLTEYAQPDDYIFPGTNGKKSDGETYYRYFKRIAEKAGYPSLTIHGARHGMITENVEGANAMEIKRMAGHSSISVTQRYTHLEVSRPKQRLKRSE